MKLLRNSFIYFNLITALLTSASVQAQTSQQSEVPSYKLQRTANTPASVQFSLSKNVYRQEPYEAEYTVQVPYTDTETYTEEIPYTETEPYTDWETYYDTEYRCHHETHYRRECHTENVCHRSRRGRPHDGGNRPDPYPGNGGGHGGGGGGHRPDPYPDHGGGGGNQCHHEQVCRDVPYSDNVCGYETVSKTRLVTKYRTVTKYRSELRTRTVTKYRTETRCCETRYRDVFDHQYSYNVTVKLPQVELAANETETLFFEIQGDEQNPQIALTLGDTVYSYQINKHEVTGANIYIELVTVPKYDRKNAGADSIGNAIVEKQGGKFVLKFTDQITDSHVKTTYTAKIKDIHGAHLADSVSVAKRGTQVLVTMSNDLSKKGPAVVEINVRRESPLIKDNILTLTVFKGVVLK